MNKPKPKTAEKDAAALKEKSGEGVWAGDIEKRGYYYDDSTGYEVYVPEDETAEDEGPEDAESNCETDGD